MADFLLVVVLSLALLAAAGAVAGFTDAAVGVLSRGVMGWRADGWPVGVQEEDRDQPWAPVARDAASFHREQADAPLAPTLARVKGSIRIR